MGTERLTMNRAMIPMITAIAVKHKGKSPNLLFLHLNCATVGKLIYLDFFNFMLNSKNKVY